LILRKVFETFDLGLDFACKVLILRGRFSQSIHIAGFTDAFRLGARVELMI
jgi:hypothetical protein